MMTISSVSEKQIDKADPKVDKTWIVQVVLACIQQVLPSNLFTASLQSQLHLHPTQKHYTQIAHLTLKKSLTGQITSTSNKERNTLQIFPTMSVSVSMYKLEEILNMSLHQQMPQP